MRRKTEKLGKIPSFKGITDILKFILHYKNNLEKRKYFLIDENYRIIKRDPSFIIELAYIYFKVKDKNRKEKIEDIIKKEFEETFTEKDRRIERMSKIKKENLIDSFRRSVLNNDSIHAVKLGNELLHRDKREFFKILYSVSLISYDENRFIKTYFIEKIVDIIEKKEGNSFNSNRVQIDEIVRNIINYFTKSEYGYIDFENESSVKYFSENKVGMLYKKIYKENYEEIVKKYSIVNTRKIKFEGNDNEDYNKLSESMKELYDSLQMM